MVRWEILGGVHSYKIVYITVAAKGRCASQRLRITFNFNDLCWSALVDDFRTFHAGEVHPSAVWYSPSA